jgi:uncharacterized cupredoxin-like copper-binding protein
MRPAATKQLIPVVLVAAACSAAGCAGGGGSQPAAGGAVVRVAERDFRISVTPAVVRPGEVDLVSTNAGPDVHELLVARADGPLPMRRDGLTVNEEALAPRLIGEVPGSAPSSRHTLRLHLRPGRYVLFCNMAGHYLGGMQAQLVVR